MVHTGEFFVDLNIEEDMEFIKVLEELKTIRLDLYYPIQI